MTHILGLEHSLGGIIGQVGGFLGSSGVLGGDWNYPSDAGFGWFGPTGATTTVSPNGNGNGAAQTQQPAIVTGGGMAGRCNTAGSTELREVVVDKATGAVICIRPKKTRHRRRRLATNSDIADLTSLKSVLGPKLTMEWIATRGRR